jgi:hypothetical protein
MRNSVQNGEIRQNNFQVNALVKQGLILLYKLTGIDKTGNPVHRGNTTWGDY